MSAPQVGAPRHDKPAPAKPHDDEFGAGLFEEPAPKRAAPQAAAPAMTPPPLPVQPTKAPKPADEDDGFGAGLL